MRVAVAGWLVVLALMPLPGCAAGSYQDVLIKDVPHVKQKPGFAGEACAEMWLKKLGSKLTQEDVFHYSGVDPLLGRGCNAEELAAALTKMGFKVGNAPTRLEAGRADEAAEAEWRALCADGVKGVPSVVSVRSVLEGGMWTFLLVLGYDGAKDEVVYHDPARDGGAYLRMKREAFLRLWPQPSGDDKLALVRIRLEPGVLEEGKSQQGLTSADFAQHLMKLKARVPPGFTMLLQRPFVVLGDDTPAKVRVHSERTVKWAVEMLKKDFFEKDPDEILDIWLFRDKESYEKNTEKVFGEKPISPFGYFSEANRALIMNIGTGGGTLVHEIVHPFMKSNFPECPSWFNEGLASLYEQCGEKDGHIHGYTNWRLARLQEAIRAGSVPSFEKLTSTTSAEFYNQDKGTHYAQARYLCYYLQEEGLLVKFYRDFRANHKDDPTGYKTLVKVLGGEDMDAFKKKWEAFVLKLEFR